MAKHESTQRTISADLPRLVEIMGPAGSGKTTLIRALCQRNGAIQADFHYSRLKKTPILIGNTLSMLPTYLRGYRHSRWFDWRETRSMVYLKAGLQYFRQGSPNHHTVTLLDHGPIYRLATLCEFGPEVTTSPPYLRWWDDLFSQWAATLDMVVYLDAPNGTLLDRIRARDRWHMIKEDGDSEAYEFLTRYRTTMDRLIDEAMAAGQIRLLRFDTNQESVEQMVNIVLDELALGQPVPSGGS